MGWITHDSTLVYENAWIRVREDRISGPAGDGIYGVVSIQHPAVFIVALDDDERVCLVTLDRYTTGRSIEIPAGGSDGEDPAVAAQREFREETGHLAEDWTLLATTNALNGVAEATEHVFLARGVRSIDDAAATRNTEGIRAVDWVPFPDVLAMIADGRITDGETIAAIALAGIRIGRFR